MREEELKNKVAKDFFANFDSTKINDNIDFWICPKNNFFTQSASYLWAEVAKSCQRWRAFCLQTPWILEMHGYSQR